MEDLLKNLVDRINYLSTYRHELSAELEAAKSITDVTHNARATEIVLIKMRHCDEEAIELSEIYGKIAGEIPAEILSKYPISIDD